MGNLQPELSINFPLVSRSPAPWECLQGDPGAFPNIKWPTRLRQAQLGAVNTKILPRCSFLLPTMVTSVSTSETIKAYTTAAIEAEFHMADPGTHKGPRRIYRHCTKSCRANITQQRSHLKSYRPFLRDRFGQYLNNQTTLTGALNYQICPANFQERATIMAATAVFRQGLPFTTFEGNGMQELYRLLHADWKPPSTSTITNRLPTV